MKTIIISLFTLILMASCKKNDSESSPETPSLDTIYIDTSSYIDPAIEENRIQDSINKEQKRIHQQELAEDKHMKLTDAETAINNFSVELMSIVSPNSGKNLQYRIIDEETYYNEDTRTLQVTFETSWDAIVGYSFSDPENHLFKGQYIIYGPSVETRFEEIFKNDVLIRAIKANQAMSGFLKFIDSASKSN